MKRLIVAALILCSSTTAFAFHCPKDAAAIDAGLAKAKLSDEDRAKIMSLRDKGMEEHKAGDHASAVNTLAEAMRLLLNDMQ